PSAPMTTLLPYTTLFRSPGEWNAYEITVMASTYDVRLNGHLVNRFIDDQQRPLEGYVGLQNYPYTKAPYDRPVRHRNVRIKELPDRKSTRLNSSHQIISY